MMRVFQHNGTFLLLATIILIAGCERAPVETDELEPTLSSIQANIFNASCAVTGCHLGAAAPHGLDLSAGNARGNLVNVASEQVPTLNRVQPGNPNDSYLIIKLEGDARMAQGTQRMPLGRPALSASEIGVIRQWITNNAPAN